ncbi:MAG: dienelactone hydrolase family protein [Sedimentisphaerales bacterium]|nr:dienelactone hydrolase family protein [Sedimentisphaerales bacterium]
MQMNVIEEQIIFSCGSLKLSGILAYPESREPEKAVLLCSPHPHFAGDMENNVIQNLAKYFAKDSITLRFNYRGVGKSEINLPSELSIFDYWQQIENNLDYHDAIEDVRAAAKELARSASDLSLVIIGYSFGVATGFKYGMENKSKSILVGIAPPIGKVNFDFLQSCKQPCLVISGKEDFLYTSENLEQFCKSCSDNATIDIWEKSDHFFRSEEEKLAIAIDSFIQENIEKKEKE